MRYRKKPVVVEAVLLSWDTWNEVCEFAGVGQGDGQTHRALAISTLEGTMIATEGDCVIRGVKGELYPCRPDIFAATYEPA